MHRKRGLKKNNQKTKTDLVKKDMECKAEKGALLKKEM